MSHPYISCLLPLVFNAAAFAGDVCDLPIDPGPCDGVCPRYAYNVDTGQCEEFTWGCCGGNANNFETLAECIEACTPNVCDLPLVQGPCEAAIIRYGRSPCSGQCEQFIYGGCDGNGNNFETLEECVAACQPNDLCDLPIDQGPCKAVIQRHAYNKCTGHCEIFNWGGCQGNANNFMSAAECAAACPSPTETCELGIDPGPCGEAIPRFAYDICAGRCVPFDYGGCGGNSNNFETMNECIEACQADDDLCQLPPDPGDCKAAIIRFAYNPCNGECEPFTWGGCDGNANRFATLEECAAVCPLTACVDLADCADLDNDGIRDDNCVWWECHEGACLGTDIIFADMGGMFGLCPPDGAVEANDRFHALNCFANSSPFGGPYECEEFPPAALNVDAGGPFGDCDSDGVCDGNDAFHVLDVFAGKSPCSCPLDSGPHPHPPDPVVVGPATVRLNADRKTIAQGEFVVVDVLLASTLKEFRGYQLHLQSSGGDRGAVQLVDIAIRRQTVLTAQTRGRTRAQNDAWSAFNVAIGQMVAGISHRGVTANPGYLATFVFRATDDAAGAFVIDLLHNDSADKERTFLFTTLSNGKVKIETHSIKVDVQ